MFGQHHVHEIPFWLLWTRTPGDRSPYGLHHMAGNVAEWVQDWFGLDYYAYMPRQNPAVRQAAAIGRAAARGRARSLCFEPPLEAASSRPAVGHHWFSLRTIFSNPDPPHGNDSPHAAAN